MLSAFALSAVAWTQSFTLSAGVEHNLSNPTCCSARVGGTVAPKDGLPLVLGGSFSYNPRPLTPTDLDIALVQLHSFGESSANFYWPIDQRQFTLELIAGVEPLRWERHRLAGGPVFFGGLGLARVESAAVVYDGDRVPAVAVIDHSAHFALPVLAGAGLQGWFSERLGLRLTWSTDAYVADNPRYNPDVPADGKGLVIEKTVNLDLLVAK